MSRRTKKFTAISTFIEKAQKTIMAYSRKPLTYTIGLILAVTLLLATSVYAGYHASNAYSTDSNAIILTQLFSKTVHYPVILPGPHATLLVIPLAYIQGHLPYHYTSFTLVNMGLVILTMLGWAYLLIKLFGRKYEIPILILLSSLIFTSVTFSLSLGYIAIRNIEYPIVLWFVMIVAYLIRGVAITRKQLVLGIIGSLLFIITLAGDSFFNYAILLPLLFVIGWYWVQSRQFTINMVKALALIVGVVVGAGLLKFVLESAHIIHFDYTFWGPNTILPIDKFWPSLGVALKQLLDMHGAFIFGQIVNYHNMYLFVNFGLLIIGVVSIFAILVTASRNYYRNKTDLTDNATFVLVTMAISYFVTFFIYALSGYAITTLSNGQIISDQNARYISLMPLITVIAIVWFLKNYYQRHIALIGLVCAVLILGIFTSHPGVSFAYGSGSAQLELAPTRGSINQMIDILQKNGVTDVQTDYWYGPVLRFWSNGTIGINAQVGCNAAILANPSNANFTHQKGKTTALIIDRGGLNYDFWLCSDDQIAKFYGTPTTKNLSVPGAAANTQVEIWIYKNAR